MVKVEKDDESNQEESKGEDVEMTVCNGPVKPKIVFFGEKLNEWFHWGWDRIRNKEFWGKEENPPDLFEDGGCDLMIVIGTALAVFPFCATVHQAPKGTPTVLINLHNTDSEGFDF
jgi:NAD-dependent SIR2 family protein deacetylase